MGRKTPFEDARESGRITPSDLTLAVVDVIAEGHRQRAEEGYSEADDDEHTGKEMLAAGVCYLIHADDYLNAGEPPPTWPFAPDQWKPKDWRSNMVRGTALVLKELERLDRRVTKALAEKDQG